MDRRLGLIAVGALLLAGCGTAAAAPHQRTESPPECVSARIIENSGVGPTLWVDWCGTGSGGEPPMDASTFVVVDGGPLTAAACRRLAPCVVLWPGSPRS